MESSENLLTREELAALLNVSLRTVDTIQKKGMLSRPPLVPLKIGRCVRFDGAKVVGWLNLEAPPITRRGRGRPKKHRPGSNK